MKPRFRISRPALVGFLTYGMLAVAIGEQWPLSRFPMYAHMGRDGAVPIVLADGEAVPVESLDGLHGCGRDDVRIPTGVPTRMGWRQDEIQRWVTSHGATRPGDVEVVFGYAMLRYEDGKPALDDAVVPLCTGTGRRR